MYGWLQHSPSGGIGREWECNLLEFDESEFKDDADEDEMLDEDEDKDDDDDSDGDEGDKTTSLEMEISLTDSKDVLFINTILLMRVWALMSKSSPSSSSSTYRNRKTKFFVNIMKNTSID